MKEFASRITESPFQRLRPRQVRVMLAQSLTTPSDWAYTSALLFRAIRPSSTNESERFFLAQASRPSTLSSSLSSRYHKTPLRSCRVGQKRPGL